MAINVIGVLCFFPTKYMGKTTNTFGRLKFCLPQLETLNFKPKFKLQVEQATKSY